MCNVGTTVLVVNVFLLSPLTPGLILIIPFAPRREADNSKSPVWWDVTEGHWLLWPCQGEAASSPLPAPLCSPPNGLRPSLLSPSSVGLNTPPRPEDARSQHRAESDQRTLKVFTWCRSDGNLSPTFKALRMMKRLLNHLLCSVVWCQKVSNLIMLQLALFATFVTLKGCDLEKQPRDLFFVEGNKLCDFDCKDTFRYKCLFAFTLVEFSLPTKKYIF